MPTYVTTSIAMPATSTATAAGHFPYGRRRRHAAAVTSSVARNAATVATTRAGGASSAARPLPGMSMSNMAVRPYKSRTVPRAHTVAAETAVPAGAVNPNPTGSNPICAVRMGDKARHSR
ncbi:hypothetical protein ABZW18_00535 [Streptomyces sp. NPDC004647]|uniref:hypothetical protein n=1 Tax=Streptomyces sp. NPDC004647 TaxID=3154671 RepID=UPI0033BD3FE8